MFLQRRNRILRNNASIRSLVAETTLKPSDFIAPLFVDEGENIAFEIPSMPGYYRRSIDATLKEVKELIQLHGDTTKALFFESARQKVAAGIQNYCFANHHGVAREAGRFLFRNFNQVGNVFTDHLLAIAVERSREVKCLLRR